MFVEVAMVVTGDVESMTDSKGVGVEEEVYIAAEMARVHHMTVCEPALRVNERPACD